MVPNFLDAQFQHVHGTSLNMELRRVANKHFPWVCDSCPWAWTFYLGFEELSAHSQASRSLFKGAYGYLCKYCNFLFTGPYLLGLMTYPLIHLPFLPFCTWCSTPSCLLQILHLWWLIYFCFSRPCLPSTQFPVFGLLCFPPPCSR